jgi:hypothetical protein
MTTELDTRIEATKRGSCVFVDKYDEGVWLSIQLSNGSANCTLSIEAAKEMIAALTRIVEASE